jgi:hypothetical protein
MRFSAFIELLLPLDIENLRHLVAEVVYDLYGYLTRSGLVEWATHRGVKADPCLFGHVCISE